MRLADSKFAVKFRDKYPIITATINDHEQLNPLLEAGIREVGDQQNRNTNVKADMTHHQMWRDKYPAHEQFQVVCQMAGQLAIQHCPEKVRPFFRPAVTEVWGAVYRKGEYTRAHDHWPAIWSFSYYVNVCSKCAPIVFPGADLTVKPQNGMFVLFPGWIEHKVPKQKCDHDRVMIAGNMGQDLDLTDEAADGF